MKSMRTITSMMCCANLAVLSVGCDQNNSGKSVPSGNNTLETTPAPPPGTAAAARNTATSDTVPPDRPPAAASQQPTAGSNIDGATLHLAGITMTIPDGWVAQPVSPGPMAPVAVFALPKADGAQEDGSVRITYFPAMKGKDDLNIDRWLGQTARADGTPTKREDAKIEYKDIGNVHLKTVDVSGAVKATMRSAAQPGGRMIAAIVDHPRGPHFVVATGETATIAKWERAVHDFLGSVKAD